LTTADWFLYAPAMPDNPARAWQHPWLRVSRLIRGITRTHWSADIWPEAKRALGWALAERGRLKRSAWFQLTPSDCNGGDDETEEGH
jgi:hypothetical protein